LVTDAQVTKLMDEMSTEGRAGVAALRAGMHRNTARRYLRAGKPPSELKAPRYWPEVVEQLRAAPELKAKALFEDLVRRRPERYEEGQLRTFQRRVKRWRAEHGPPQEVLLPQERPARRCRRGDRSRRAPRRRPPPLEATAREVHHAALADDRHLQPRTGGEVRQHRLARTVLPIMANHIRALVSKMFNFGISRDIVEHNPCVGVPLLAQNPGNATGCSATTRSASCGGFSTTRSR
jgi:hypothetical protein